MEHKVARKELTTYAVSLGRKRVSMKVIDRSGEIPLSLTVAEHERAADIGGAGLEQGRSAISQRDDAASALAFSFSDTDESETGAVDRHKCNVCPLQVESFSDAQARS